MTTTTQEDIVSDPTTDIPAEMTEAALNATTPVVSKNLLSPKEVRDRLVKIESELNTYFVERKPLTRAALLGILTGEHVYILGPPGTGKTYFTRALFACFTGSRYFEAGLTKTTPAEAILGPYDIPELKNNGNLFRRVEGFLPTCEFAMLDEIGKVSSTLGHNMLHILLDRRLHMVKGGKSWVEVPLRTAMGGSNEWLTTENDENSALQDRFLVRVLVDQVKESGNFAQMMSQGPWKAKTEVDFESLANVIDNVVPAINIPADVMTVIVTLANTLRDEEIDISGRRWMQSRKLLQANAYLEGRTEVDADDIAVLRFSLWPDPRDIDKVERITLKVSNPFAEAALGLLEKVREVAGKTRDSKGMSTNEKVERFISLGAEIKVIQRELGNAKQKALQAGASTLKFDEVETELKTVRAAFNEDILGTSEI